jgi:hypothetical protein
MKPAAIVSALLATLCLTFSGPAAADEDHGGPTYWHPCVVIQVAAFANRVHVQCANPSIFGVIKYFAVPTSSAGEAARLTALGTAAMAGGKPLAVEAKYSVNPSIDGNYAAWGCAEHDCRRALGMALNK